MCAVSAWLLIPVYHSHRDVLGQSSIYGGFLAQLRRERALHSGAPSYSRSIIFTTLVGVWVMLSSLV